MGNRHKALVGLTLVFGCAPGPLPSPLPVDGGSLEDCERACATLARLGCDEAEPTTDGGTCVDVCWNAESSGYYTMRPACVAEIETCAEMDECAP